MYDFDEIMNTDPEIADAIKAEMERQNSHIELIASENWVSKAVMAAMGSPLTNKYAEGYPGKRYYGGCQYVDVVETIAIERAKKLFGDLKAMGYNTCIISNNKEYRVKPLADEVGSLYVSKAGKPSPKNYVKAMEYMNTDKSDTYFVGDQLFTDVWGANRAGIKSVLVKPIDKHEEIQIILKRKLEWIVLHFYKKHIKKEGGKAGF